ncbi:MAG: hypothetical protein KAX38_07825, partial [Candidatus Krumholzibacteria bacterium]|nr:hypothetical protein [Candidatus Krumholzibacteria bacterium]
VDEIKTFNPLSSEIIEDIRRRIGKEWIDVKDVMLRTSRLLSKLTSYMGLIMGIYDLCSIVKRFRIIQLEGHSGLVVLTLVPDREKRVYVEFPKRYLTHIISRAEQIINERIAGHSLEEAPERLESYLREGSGIERDIAEAVAAEAESLFDWQYDFNYYFKSSDNHIKIPELRSAKVLRNLVSLMGERSLILKVMKDRIGHELTVTIGKENEIEEMEDFSIITHSFSTSDYAGLIGILGPTRMSYDLVLSLLNRMAEELHRL